MSNLLVKDTSPKIEKPKPVPIKILPHPQAPLMSREDGPLIFKQVIGEVLSGRFSTSNPEIRELIRQAGFVSLWFFQRGIAAYNGPYERLTNHLHVDMANHYQDFMYPGSWSAFFIFRSGYKSTELNYGANAWEILRNPDISIGIGSAITKRADSFRHHTQRIFDSNELVEWLYPEYVPELNAPYWNNDVMIMPNRSRYKPAPTIQTIAVGASTQGIHVELMKLDDIVGDDQLNAFRSATADMIRAGQWLRTNINTLVDEPEQDRICLMGTRYGIEDPYEFVMENIKDAYGYWEDIPRGPKDGGRWEVYYRQAIEYGKAIFPEKLSKKRILQIREDDIWNYLTQYMNNPYTHETAEFVEMVPGVASLTYEPNSGWMVGYELHNKLLDSYEYREFFLDDCDLVVSADPAGTKKDRRTTKTSRSAVGLIVTTPDGVRILARLKVGYVRITEVMNWLFDFHKNWKPRVTALEAQGAFKILEDVMYEEQKRRGKYISLVPIKASTDKVVRIRAALEPLLTHNRFYVTKETEEDFNGERVGFPGSNMKDILDMCAQGVTASIIPEDPERREEDEQEREQARARRSKYTGY